MAISGETVHIVWEENGRVYHRFGHGQDWSIPRSIATGEQPAIAMDAAGNVHLMLVNEFDGNYEIYYCCWNGATWSLPRNASNTSGVSSAPSVALALNGTVHAVWADNTPGYTVIYHGYWNGKYWINEPIPNATGGAPAVAVDADGSVHVVWQDRDSSATPYEVYYSCWNQVSWALPENLSDSPTEASIIPSLVTDGADQVHVVWQEKVNGAYAIFYTRRMASSWSVPEMVSDGTAESYLPCIVHSRGASIYTGWDQDTQALYRQRGVNAGQWSRIDSVMCNPVGVADLQLAVDSGSRLHAAWTQRVGSDNWDVFYMDLTHWLALPILLRNASR